MKAGGLLTMHSELAYTTVNLHELIDGHSREMNLRLLPEGTILIRAQFFDETPLFGLPLADVCIREVRMGWFRETCLAFDDYLGA